MDTRVRQEVRQKIRTCTECALSQKCRQPIPFYGPSPSSIAVVGEAPGKYEDIQDRPFVGPAGKLAHSWLDRAGVDSQDVAWLNVVSCFPNRTPTGNEVAACRSNLAAQLEIIRPDFLLVLGGIAASVWHPNLRIGDLRGQWWTASYLAESSPDAAMAQGSSGSWSVALATWHPAAVLRNRGLYQAAFTDITYFVMVAKGEVGAVISDRCVMCNGASDLSENDIAWCQKHWDQKHGKAGLGRKKKAQFTKRKVKDQRLIEME